MENVSHCFNFLLFKKVLLKVIFFCIKYETSQSGVANVKGEASFWSFLFVFHDSWIFLIETISLFIRWEEIYYPINPSFIVLKELLDSYIFLCSCSVSKSISQFILILIGVFFQNLTLL